jgi:hypothetical protein
MREIKEYFQKHTMIKGILPVAPGTQFVIPALGPFEIISPQELLWVIREADLEIGWTGAYATVLTAIQASKFEVILKDGPNFIIGEMVPFTNLVVGIPFNSTSRVCIPVNHVLLPGSRFYIICINWNAMAISVNIGIKLDIFDKNVLENYKITDIMKFCNEIQ